MTNQIVICGDNIEVLKTYPDNYFDAVVTDPPYGLGKEPNAEEVMKGWVDKGYHEVGGSGFMGKEWDAFIPQPIFWKEVFRVLKHGGHVVSFFGTRTYDWGVMSMRFAGFEVRDCIQWLYGSGFPKSHNIAKSLEAKILFNDGSGRSQKLLDGERVDAGMFLHKISYEQGVEKKDYSIQSRDKVIDVNFQTEEAKQWDGWGSALKPANEPIVLARKPVEKGLSIAENVLKWGVGGINIDGCRVGRHGATERKGESVFKNESIIGQVHGTRGYSTGHEIAELNKGRFPANLILTHHPECECKGLKKIKAIKGGSGIATMNSGMGKNGIYGAYSHEKLGENAGGLGDENGEETIEHWECHPDCPIRIMDEQSGILKTTWINSKHQNNRNKDDGFLSSMKHPQEQGYNDTGGASRFFYCAKASKSERNNGLEGFEGKRPDERTTKDKQSNFHPTVKPVKLMQYLARLITPPNGKVLDPFCGSGTTGIACKLEEFEFVGIEQDAEYTKIAQARIENYEEEPLEPLELIQEDSKGNTITQTSLF